MRKIYETLCKLEKNAKEISEYSSDLISKIPEGDTETSSNLKRVYTFLEDKLFELLYGENGEEFEREFMSSNGSKERIIPLIKGMINRLMKIAGRSASDALIERITGQRQKKRDIDVFVDEQLVETVKKFSKNKSEPPEITFVKAIFGENKDKIPLLTSNLESKDFYNELGELKTIRGIKHKGGKFNFIFLPDKRRGLSYEINNFDFCFLSSYYSNMDGLRFINGALSGIKDRKLYINNLKTPIRTLLRGLVFEQQYGFEFPSYLYTLLFDRYRADLYLSGKSEFRKISEHNKEVFIKRVNEEIERNNVIHPINRREITKRLNKYIADSINREPVAIISQEINELSEEVQSLYDGKITEKYLEFNALMNNPEFFLDLQLLTSIKNFPQEFDLKEKVERITKYFLEEERNKFYIIAKEIFKNWKKFKLQLEFSSDKDVARREYLLELFKEKYKKETDKNIFSLIYDRFVENSIYQSIIFAIVDLILYEKNDAHYHIKGRERWRRERRILGQDTAPEHFFANKALFVIDTIPIELVNSLSVDGKFEAMIGKICYYHNLDSDPEIKKMNIKSSKGSDALKQNKLLKGIEGTTFSELEIYTSENGLRLEIFANDIPIKEEKFKKVLTDNFNIIKKIMTVVTI